MNHMESRFRIFIIRVVWLIAYNFIFIYFYSTMYDITKEHYRYLFSTFQVVV